MQKKTSIMHNLLDFLCAHPFRDGYLKKFAMVRIGLRPREWDYFPFFLRNAFHRRMIVSRRLTKLAFVKFRCLFIY